MLDSFKASLSYVNSFTWSTLSLSILLLFLDPTEDKINILGIGFNQSSVVYIGPFVIIMLLLAKRIVISNAAYIVNANRKNSDLKKLIKFYPVPEFMRWRSVSNLETMLLTAFDVALGYLPAFAIFFILIKITQDNWIRFLIATVVGFLIGRLVQWNYSTLRFKVYEPICGKINTPD